MVFLTHDPWEDKLYIFYKVIVNKERLLLLLLLPVLIIDAAGGIDHEHHVGRAVSGHCNTDTCGSVTLLRHTRTLSLK